MKFIKNHGGREKYFLVNLKKHRTNDCVIRAIAIATEIDYLKVRDSLFDRAKSVGRMPNDKEVYEAFLKDSGWIKNSPIKNSKGKKVDIVIPEKGSKAYEKFMKGAISKSSQGFVPNFAPRRGRYYDFDETLGTYRHQDFTHSSENLRQAITDNIVFKLRESGTEIDEKLQLKIEKRIDMKLDPHFGKLEQLVIKRSSEAIDTAIQNEADRLMGTVREDSRSKLPLSEKYQIQMGSFINHVKHQVDNDVITPEHGQKWIDKVQREYSTQITESFLKSGKPEDLEKFKALQGTELYKDVPPLKRFSLIPNI